jgi:two-component sensor histidine kinase
MPFTAERKSKIELAFYSELIPDLYMSGLVPQLYLSAVQSTQHCLAGGMDESVIYSFSIMGLYLGEQEYFEEAFKYEDLAKNLSEKYPNTFGATRGMNGVVWCNMHSRNKPEEVINYCQKSIQSGKNCGDLYNAGLSYGPLMWNLQVQCRNIQEIENYARECLHFSQKFNLSFSVGLAEAVLAGWIEPMLTSEESVPIQEKIKTWEASNHIASAGSYFVLRGISAYYFGEYLQSEVYLQRVNQYLSGLTDNVLKRQWFAFRVLNAIRLHSSNLAYQTKKELLDYIDPIIKKLETWSQLGPLLKPFLLLIYAEKEKTFGSRREARSCYLDAINLAKIERYTLLEAFISETLGEFLIQQGQPIGNDYLLTAAKLYQKCKAEKKENNLFEKYPELEPNLATTAQPETSEVDFNTFVLPDLDVNYLMKSALAISAETNINSLLNKIMTTVIEASGAQHGYLIMMEDGDLIVRAESHISDKNTVKSERHPLKEAKNICQSIVKYVQRTKELLILSNASEDKIFRENIEVQTMHLKSVYCHPLIEKTELIGIIFLENRLFDSVFNEKRAKTTSLLAAQATTSIENARLIESMKKAEEQIKQSLREKEILLKEIHHRVKNNLQVISSLFNLQSRYLTDKNYLDLFKDSQNRVRSMAIVHEKLHQSEDMTHVELSDYIHILTSNLFKSYGIGTNQILVNINIPKSHLNIELVIPLGLIINELLTNSIKHAFHVGKKGEISIGLEVGNEYILTIKDNGVGLPENFNIAESNSLGLQLIHILSEQIGGSVKCISNKGFGTEISILWPVAKFESVNNSEKGFQSEKIQNISR